jgi:flavin reductase (DIM6/NTAB) family NADH-FMN oxidoreductase RutF
MDSASHDHSYLSILGKVPSGIYILSAKHGDDVTGMLASWVMQAGFDPPMVTVAVNKSRYLADWLQEGAAFALNVVSEEGKKLLGHFGRGFEPGVPAFENLSCSHHETGVVLLEEGVIGHFVCIPKAYVESGDHLIVVAEVIDGKSLNETRPMVHVRKRGDTY